MQRAWPLLFRLPGINLPLPFPAVSGAGYPLVPLMRGNAAMAQDYYRGQFAFAGAEVSAGPQGVLDIPAPSEAWIAGFHGFGWLADLEASGLELHKAFARTLLDQWMARRNGLPRAARVVHVATRRLISLIAHAPFLLRGASAEFHARYCRTLTSEFAALAGLRGAPCGPEERFAATVALAQACAGLRGLEPAAASVFAKLDSEIDAQILADGGHVSRNPANLPRFLLDLMPLKNCLAAGRRQGPRRLDAAIERMLPMLRLLSHGDGGLAVFQGVSSFAVREARAVLDNDCVLGQPLSHAPQSGYARLQRGSAVLIADAGASRACHGPLAFEFSDGPSRIVGNCGLPSQGSAALAAAASRVDGHSTACFHGEPPTAGLWARLTGRAASAELSVPALEVSAGPEGGLIRAANFHAAPGLCHERRLYLSAQGNDLRGEDRFTGGGPAAAYAVRFHLHPAIKATLSKDGGQVTLLTAARHGWQFSARGGRLSLDESILLAGTPRKSQQIVISGDTAATARINWAFKRIDKQAGSKAKSPDAPGLPF